MEHRNGVMFAQLGAPVELNVKVPDPSVVANATSSDPAVTLEPNAFATLVPELFAAVGD
jgi:hypothetical protein